VAGHDCRAQLLYRAVDYADNLDPEVDGAIERWTEEWWECAECGERYDAADLERWNAGEG
jgi:hypothetical protein